MFALSDIGRHGSFSDIILSLFSVFFSRSLILLTINCLVHQFLENINRFSTKFLLFVCLFFLLSYSTHNEVFSRSDIRGQGSFFGFIFVSLSIDFFFAGLNELNTYLLIFPLSEYSHRFVVV